MFTALKAPVGNRGPAPDAFLKELVAWGKAAPDDIFAPNRVPVDIYTVIKSSLATKIGTDFFGNPIYAWESMGQRRAAMLETMRVHAGRESSWVWAEGVDRTNRTSMAHVTGQETGIFQVSFDSEWISHNAMQPFAQAHDIATPEKFIPALKRDHALALEYYARLCRVSIAWAGPLLRHGEDSVYPYLSRAAVAELQGLLG